MTTRTRIRTGIRFRTRSTALLFCSLAGLSLAAFGCDGTAPESEDPSVSTAQESKADDTESHPACGGRIGRTCNARQYCRYQSQGDTCGASDRTGTCETRPTFCPEIFNPVCGCDGQSYGNSCEARTVGIDVAHAGQCADAPHPCGGFAGIGCGADEWCHYDDNGTACGYADGGGTCEKRPEICSREQDPVCGCDGRTYGNACTAHGAGADVASRGACL